MEIPDTPTVAQLAVRSGLVTEEQLQEAYVETDPKGTNPQPLLSFLERKGYLTPWQSYKLLKLDPDGYYLGGYRILYKIASGSFGRVFRADDRARDASLPSRCFAGGGAKIRSASSFLSVK